MAVITSVWFVPSLTWLMITNLMGVSFIVAFTPIIPMVICLVVSLLMRYFKCKKMA
mgnify:CR=1 FL=1